MKKVLTGILTASIILMMLPSVVFASEEHLNIFVQNGANGGNGTISEPFGTIEEARDYIRELKKNGEYPYHGVTVNLRAGDYRIEKSIQFTEEDSGTAEGPVTYRPYINEQVTLNGGVSIDLYEFENIKDEAILSKLPENSKNGVKQYNLYENGITREMFGEMNLSSTNTFIYTDVFGDINTIPVSPIFFDGKRVNIARWPNEGYQTIDKVEQEGHIFSGTDFESNKEKYKQMAKNGEIKNMIIGIPAEKASVWANAEDLYIYGNWRYTWAYTAMPVKSINTKDNLLETMYHGHYGAAAGGRYYVYNCLEELDIPNEYYLDRDTGMLYFFPSKASGAIEIPLIKEDLLVFNNVSNMRFKGLTIKNGCQRGFVVTGAENFGIEHCSISDFEQYAVSMTGANNSYVRSSHLYNMGAGAITIGGGDVKTITPSGSYVENCWIHDFAQVTKTYQPAVYVSGVGTRASFNRINDAPHAGILFAGNSPNMLINNNEIYNVLKESSDSGAIYGGKTWTGRGLTITNNYIHDLAEGRDDAHGVYLDDFFCGATVKSNIFENISGYRCSAVAGGGRNTTITDNIFLNCYSATRGIANSHSPEAWYEANIGTWNATNGYGLLGDYDEEIYAETFPDFLDYGESVKTGITPEDLKDLMSYKHSVFADNYGVNLETDVYWNVTGGIQSEKDRFKSIQWAEEDYVPTIMGANPGFEDIANKKYTLNDDAEIYDNIPDFEDCDFENIGVYTQRLKDKLGNAISLKIGSPISYSGFKEEIIDDENFDVTPVIINSRTMLPVRYLAEILGGSAQWDDGARIATLNIGDDSIELDIANGTIKKNGELIESDTAPMIYEGRTIAPLRAVAEALDKNIDWHDGGYDNQLIFISDAQIFDKDDEIDKMYIKEMSGLLGVK